uniref:Glycosyl transferase family 39 n=2 Tax=Gloeothece TaxID=28070 RepID=E0UH62_GLOV7|nr:glycosyltransferase family 39 protein [Gloeothece verrucosa]ADN15661.1 glycosyl transferase family 39 [Gloeothece verrucosa PCC 7822]
MRLSTNQNPKTLTGKSYQWLLLILWTVLGCGLRFLNLTAKPPWTDEFATMVFSLGNNYDSVLLNQVISPEMVLQPLRLNRDATIFDVISLLLDNDNHPPLYFVLAHWWMNLWPGNGEYISVWAARSLPALLGGLSIPAVYYLARIAFGSAKVAHLSAIMMAVSPYGVFIAQEARHYTLAILFVIFSLCCLLRCAKHFQKKTAIPMSIVFLWLMINCLGLATHYFFSLTLAAEALTLILILYYSIKNSLLISSKTGIPSGIFKKNCWRLALVAFGTITTAIAWVLLLVPHDYGKGMTEWIHQDNFNFIAFISPVFQLMAAWVTMIALLPIESSFLPLAIFSGLLMLLFFVWAIPKLNRGLKMGWQNRHFRLGIGVLLGFIVSAIVLFFAITYCLGLDITRGARYSFVYFPAVPVILGVILAGFLEKKFAIFSSNWKVLKVFEQPKIIISIIIFMGFLSCLTITFNLGYKKYYLPNQLVEVIESSSSHPVLIATTHQNLVQTGEMMGIAWQLQKKNLPVKLQFLLAHHTLKMPEIATITLEKTVNKLTLPLEVWTVNFKAPVRLNNCRVDAQSFPHINGYNYQRYDCQ